MAGSVIKNMNSKMLQRAGTGTMINLGLGAVFGVMDYKIAREEGRSVPGSVIRATATGIMPEIMGLPAFLGMQAAMAIPSGAIKTYEGLGQRARSMSRQSQNIPFDNSQFVDTQQAYTMRQAGMKMAQASKYNLQQSMLGNEAQMLHI